MEQLNELQQSLSAMQHQLAEMQAQIISHQAVLSTISYDVPRDIRGEIIGHMVKSLESPNIYLGFVHNHWSDNPLDHHLVFGHATTYNHILYFLKHTEKYYYDKTSIWRSVLNKLNKNHKNVCGGGIELYGNLLSVSSARDCDVQYMIDRQKLALFIEIILELIEKKENFYPEPSKFLLIRRNGTRTFSETPIHIAHHQNIHVVMEL